MVSLGPAGPRSGRRNRSKFPGPSDLAKRARERRDITRSQVSRLCFDGSVDPATAVLSNPACHTKLAFPFVGLGISSRFNVNLEDDSSWFYMGREKFEILLRGFHAVQNSCDITALWLYGTQGYGKSYILAAFVCYLCARGNERVIYIPDCRELLDDVVRCFQAAMLFAWSDDASIQREIIALDTPDDIYFFLKSHEAAVYVIDQMDACTESENTFSTWLTDCWQLGKAAVLSSSAS
jgi:hypothetical protein